MTQPTDIETTVEPTVSTEVETRAAFRAVNRVFGHASSGDELASNASKFGETTPGSERVVPFTSQQTSRLGRALLRLHSPSVSNDEVISGEITGDDLFLTATSVTTVAPRFEAETLTVSAMPPTVLPATEKPASGGGSERREFPRRDSGCVVSVCRTQDNEPVGPQELDLRLNAGRLKGPLVDLSMNGVAFVLPERLADDELIHLRLTNRRIEKQTDEEGGWKAICRLEHNLPLEDVHEFTRNLGAAQWV
jgi:hypothetical protein